MSNIPKFETFKTAVLYKLYEAAIGSKSSAFQPDKVAEMFNFAVGVGYTHQALQSLEENNWANETNFYFSITESGILVVQKYLEDRNSLIANYSDLGDDWLLETYAVGSPSIEYGNTDAASDEDWEPLPIDRKTPEYEVAVEATEEVVRVVEQDNGYAANEPEERNQIVDSLKTGLRWVKEGAPSRAQIGATLLAPLKFLVSKFSGATMGEAAKVAVAAIAKWLGLGS